MYYAYGVATSMSARDSGNLLRHDSNKFNIHYLVPFQFTLTGNLRDKKHEPKAGSGK